ncbi:MAG: universal stress protein [Streptosporangiaceae bacterium]|jgi:nucleotide-binding universal stress UspA family protein
MPATNGQAPRIVVGVDGSAPSLAALRWAVRQAALTGATVDAVAAWQYPAVVAGYGWAPVMPADDIDFGEVAEKTVTDAISQVVDPGTGVRVSARVEEGNAAAVLLDVADGADLLVVGSRGHGGFAGALLGSVSQHCVHHAPCPVVIIHGAPQESRPEQAATAAGKSAAKQES